MDSMLYLSMRLPKENDPDFDLAFIKRELKAIQKMHGLPGSGEEDFFVVLSSEAVSYTHLKIPWSIMQVKNSND